MYLIYFDHQKPHLERRQRQRYAMCCVLGEEDCVQGDHEAEDSAETIVSFMLCVAECTADGPSMCSLMILTTLVCTFCHEPSFLIDFRLQWTFRREIYSSK